MNYLTLEQAAAQLSVHPKTLRRAISAGKLPAVRVGRAIRLRQADLDTFARPIPTARRRSA